jgi:hypothetical protein
MRRGGVGFLAQRSAWYHVATAGCMPTRCMPTKSDFRRNWNRRAPNWQGHSGHGGGGYRVVTDVPLSLSLTSLTRPPVMESCCHQPELPVAHAAELIPAGAKQRRHHPPLGDGLGSVAAMPEGVAVTFGRSAAFSATVKPTASPSRHSGRLARHTAPVPGAASRALMHGQVAVHGVDPPLLMLLPSPRKPDSHRR